MARTLALLVVLLAALSVGRVARADVLPEPARPGPEWNEAPLPRPAVPVPALAGVALALAAGGAAWRLRREDARAR